MDQPSIRVALVESDPGSQQRIRILLGRDAGLRLTKTFSDAESFLEKHLELRLDVVIMDIGLPHMSGIECVAKAKSERPGTQFLMYTGFENPAYIIQAFCAGATGYLFKTVGEDRMSAAIREIHHGGSPMNSGIARLVVNSLGSRSQRRINDELLTCREKGVLDGLAAGLLYKEIAAKAGISTETVRVHARRIYGKLHVRGRMEAVRKVYPGR